MIQPKEDGDGGPESAAASLISLLVSHNLSIAVAESCTGGLVAALLTDIPGSSAALWGGVVAYSNECKMRVLRVERKTIEENGAVSGETARAMARGMRELSGADLAVGITGIAGPTGGSPEKPVGLVWFGWARKGGDAIEESRLFSGDRNTVRRAAADYALRRAVDLAIKLPGVAGDKTVDIDKPFGAVYSDR